MTWSTSVIFEFLAFFLAIPTSIAAVWSLHNLLRRRRLNRRPTTDLIPDDPHSRPRIISDVSFVEPKCPRFQGPFTFGNYIDLRSYQFSCGSNLYSFETKYNEKR
ncbi:hypothetical protein BDV59DRAFT_171575 [Aspergillus ambiguus]|uniref:uncharacterized protein n=1 Tax=Aspergillus ambiguus TaxID=176160 RepID=UPI003CCE30CF